MWFELGLLAVAGYAAYKYFGQKERDYYVFRLIERYEHGQDIMNGSAPISQSSVINTTLVPNWHGPICTIRTKSNKDICEEQHFQVFENLDAASLYFENAERTTPHAYHCVFKAHELYSVPSTNRRRAIDHVFGIRDRGKARILRSTPIQIIAEQVRRYKDYQIDMKEAQRLESLRRS